MDDERREKLERRVALLKRRDKLLAEKNAKPQESHNPFMQGVNFINEIGDTHLAPISAGLLQGGLDTANFLGNLIPGALGLETVPKANVAKTFLKPGYNKSSHFLGEFGPLIAGLITSAPRAVQKAASSELGQKLAKGISAEKTGKSMLNKYLTNEGASAEEFGNLFKQANEAGAPLLNMKIPEKDLKVLQKIVGPEMIENHLARPTAESAHFLRSKLNQYAKKIEKEGSKAHPSYEHRARKAKEYAEKLRGGINESLGSVNEEFPRIYQSARENFKKNVVPFRNVGGDYFSKAAQEAGSKGYIYPRRLPEKALSQSGDPLTSALMEQIPELGSYELLHPSFGKIAGRGAAGYGIYQALKNVFGGG